MANKSESYTKKIGKNIFSTHEGTGLDSEKFGVGDAVFKEMSEKRSFLENLFSSDTVAGVKVVIGGESAKLIGFKINEDQGELKVKAVVASDGKVNFLDGTQDKPLVVKFDRVTNSETNQIKGAVTNESAEKIIKIINSYSENGVAVTLGKDESSMQRAREEAGNVGNLNVVNAHGSPVAASQYSPNITNGGKAK
jgi:hypothetical protein